MSAVLPVTVSTESAVAPRVMVPANLAVRRSRAMQMVRARMHSPGGTPAQIVAIKARLAAGKMVSAMVAVGAHRIQTVPCVRPIIAMAPTM